MINQIKLGLIEDKRFDELKNAQKSLQIIESNIPNGFKRSLYVYEKYYKKYLSDN